MSIRPSFSLRTHASRAASLLVLTLVAPACGSPADAPTRDAVTALDHCDVRTAQARFADAHRADANHPQAALGFALTDFAMLPEDPHAASILANIGFTSAVDMQSLLFGTDGMLARLARHDACDSVGRFLDASIPYPPLHDPGIEPQSVLRPGLLADDFRTDAAALVVHFQQESAAFETAANAGLATYAIQGSGCGQSTPLVLQKPELFAAAAALELLTGALQIGLAYDWNFAVSLLFAQDDASRRLLLDALDAHLGHLEDAGAVTQARATLVHAMAVAVQAIDAATAARTAVDHALIDWSQFPVERLADARRMAVSLQGALSGPTPLADVTPQLTLDLSGILGNPPDAAQLTSPLFVNESAEDPYVAITLDGARLDDLLGSVTVPDQFGPHPSASLTWAPSEAWNHFMSDGVFAPTRSLGETYRCQ